MSQLKKIKLNFSDFYEGFDKKNNQFFRIISKSYDIVIDEENPDYLIYSCFGKDFLSYDCIRIFYSGENMVPDFNLCDYGISFFYLEFEDRYIRYPNFMGYGSQADYLEEKRTLSFEGLENKTKFCNFIYSNQNADPRRDEFYFNLSKYKKIDSAGRHLKNVGLADVKGQNWAESKVEFQKDYKFSIAFENSTVNGYTTEKIMHAFNAETIPIYWGNPRIGEDFNTDSFINCHDYDSFNDVVKEVIRLDNNDQEYLEMLRQEIYVKVKKPVYLEEDFLHSFFENIFNQSIVKAKRRTVYGFNRSHINALSSQNKKIPFTKKLTHKIKKLLKFMPFILKDIKKQ